MGFHSGDEVESLHLKVLLVVNQSTASSAVYGECARLPVCYAAIKNSKILVSSNQKAWISDVKKMKLYFN